MPFYEASKLILILLASITILSNISTSVALNQSVNIGVIIDEGSRAGKEQKTAIEIAVRKLNSRSKNNKLVVYFKNTKGDPLEAASSASDLINKRNVQVIIVTNTWEETALVAKIGQHAKVPVISLINTDVSQPLSRLQWPFLVQKTNLDMSDEIKFIASIVQSYNWKRVIVVYEDNMYGDEYKAVSLLSDALQKIGSFIERSVIVPHFTSPFDPEESIRKNLGDVLTTKQSRVFIVLKSSLQATTRVFEEANKLGLMGQDSVWIVGDSYSSFLDSLDTSVFQLMQGALGVKAYYSGKSDEFLDFKSNFKRVFRSNYPEEDRFEPGIYAIRAYDSIETISLAFDHFGSSNNPNSEKLLDAIRSSNFSSLTGMIDFQDEKLPELFQLVNIIGKSYKPLGFWSPRSGFSNTLRLEGHHSLIQLAINWPGDLISRIPKGWAMPSNAKKMKIGVPESVSLERFVKVEWIESSNETKYSGFCIDVFESVVSVLEDIYGYTLPYEFVNLTGSYNDMVDKVYFKEYDAVVADVTILANRTRYVDFTQPFIESGLSMVVPVKSDTDQAWRFMKPFTVEMWLATLCILLYTMFVVWFMEHKVNPEFGGPPKDQFGTALWFTFSSLFFAHRENIQSNHSKVVVMTWFFVVLILTSSYTASLTSMLTVRVLEPTVRDIEWLRKTNAPVGCDPDSFVGRYLTDVLKLKNIKNVSNQDEYPENFKNGNISAAFLEVPYQKYFLRQYCNEYTVVGPSYQFGGLGFIFPKDFPITDDVSGAILTLMEDGKIHEIENKWLGAPENCPSSNPKLETESLTLASFWGIFLISGLTSTLTLLIFLYRFFFKGYRWNNDNHSRWRKAIRIVVFVLKSHNQVKPRKYIDVTNAIDVPENLEIGRPTQLEIPMR
ncbi:hypothetical protein QVD17_17995 [Tagetes erecta]|uniref:Glutamate receptor n=1 Tax=Tagetes erecta TaxID=13708 RepID=A0AAD8KHB6_TARER|nr:hypothetical protein QVD17_17995 [Tagetes erecta]